MLPPDRANSEIIPEMVAVLRRCGYAPVAPVLMRSRDSGTGPLPGVFACHCMRAFVCVPVCVCVCLCVSVCVSVLWLIGTNGRNACDLLTALWNSAGEQPLNHSIGVFNNCLIESTANGILTNNRFLSFNGDLYTQVNYGLSLNNYYHVLDIYSRLSRRKSWQFAIDNTCIVSLCCGV